MWVGSSRHTHTHTRARAHPPLSFLVCPVWRTMVSHHDMARRDASNDVRGRDGVGGSASRHAQRHVTHTHTRVFPFTHPRATPPLSFLRPSGFYCATLLVMHTQVNNAVACGAEFGSQGVRGDATRHARVPALSRVHLACLLTSASEET